MPSGGSFNKELMFCFKLFRVLSEIQISEVLVWIKYLLFYDLNSCPKIPYRYILQITILSTNSELKMSSVKVFEQKWKNLHKKANIHQIICKKQMFEWTESLVCLSFFVAKIKQTQKLKKRQFSELTWSLWHRLPLRPPRHNICNLFQKANAKKWDERWF